MKRFDNGGGANASRWYKDSLCVPQCQQLTKMSHIQQKPKQLMHGNTTCFVDITSPNERSKVEKNKQTDKNIQTTLQLRHNSSSIIFGEVKPAHLIKYPSHPSIYWELCSSQK